MIFALSLYAQDYTLKLYEEILGALSSRFPIVVYADGQSSQILEKSSNFKVVHFCNENVEFLVGSSFGSLSSLCKKKPLFATTHRAYHKYSNAFGAFYWTKGRPQIHFNKELLERFDLHLPENLQRFADE
ncbi:hypothetical protein MNB_SM-6-1230 [hydrothermal vent metagenome]|uniref:Uncharacterized protein n=1 Tax=hydrothermal vent metagenome TaxID=652676 RepID=A0A1W1CQD5_9ZZZZ